MGQRGLPAVVHGGPARRGIELVAIDDRAAARSVGAAAFTGAQAPAVLSFPFDRARRPTVLRGAAPEAAAFSVTRHRLQGYADAAAAPNLDWARIPVVVLARNDRAEAEAAAMRLLQGDTGVDAIAAMSDELALGVLAAAHRLGTDVPAQLAVTGWDDSGAAASARLTTVAQSLREQGELCARSVIEPDIAAARPAPSWQLVIRGKQPYTARDASHGVGPTRLRPRLLPSTRGCDSSFDHAVRGEAQRDDDQQGRAGPVSPSAQRGVEPTRAPHVDEGGRAADEHADDGQGGVGEVPHRTTGHTRRTLT